MSSILAAVTAQYPLPWHADGDTIVDACGVAVEPDFTSAELAAAVVECFNDRARLRGLVRTIRARTADLVYVLEVAIAPAPPAAIVAGAAAEQRARDPDHGVDAAHAFHESTGGPQP